MPVDKEQFIHGKTIILNHSQEWDGKPTGSHRDSRVAEISKRYSAPAFFVPSHTGAAGEARRHDPGRTSDAGRHTSLKGPYLTHEQKH